MDKLKFIKRLQSIVVELKERNVIETTTQFALSIGTYSHVISAMFSGKIKRTLNLDQILLLTQKYGINANYLFGTSESMFLDDSSIISSNTTPEEIAEQSQFDKEQEEKMAIAKFLLKNNIGGYIS